MTDSENAVAGNRHIPGVDLKNRLVAFLVAGSNILFPGLGYFPAGRPGKGLAVGGLTIVVTVLSGNIYPPLAIIAGVILILYSGCDSYRILLTKQRRENAIGDRLIRVRMKNLQTYEFRRSGALIASMRESQRKGIRIHIESIDYQCTKINDNGKRFLLSRGEKLLAEAKRSKDEARLFEDSEGLLENPTGSRTRLSNAGSSKFELKFAEQEIDFRVPSIWDGTFLAFQGTEKIGEIRADGALGFLHVKSVMDLPQDWPLVVQVFSFCLFHEAYHERAAIAGAVLDIAGAAKNIGG